VLNRCCEPLAVRGIAHAAHASFLVGHNIDLMARTCLLAAAAAAAVRSQCDASRMQHMQAFFRSTSLI
jgi:hypothetical protein